MKKFNISFAGAGRVASSLAKDFVNYGHKIDLIVSASETNGRALALDCSAKWSSVHKYPDSSEVIIVCVQDNQVANVLSEIQCRKGTLVAHTAGSLGLDVFPESFQSTGIFYPVQTFTKGRKINFSEIQFLIESSGDKSVMVLKELAESLGAKAVYCNTERRRILHLSAVFACNFTNHLLTLSKEISAHGGFEYEILKPLVFETVEKAFIIGPENSQTGPAVRNDLITIEKHLELLSFSPEIQKIYKDLTNSILSHYKKH